MCGATVGVPCPDAFAPVLPLAEACHAAGGRALLVGGAVRDLLLMREGVHPPGWEVEAPNPKDLDVEVHGLPASRLEKLLRVLGPINLVGQAFAVYKLELGPHVLDVSLPRRDSRQRPGHRGILAIGDPDMGLREAARRRDLTVNALAFDPLTGTVEDPWGGLADLRARRLRAVDADTFGEDPLRALRVPQLAARFQFEVTPDLCALCSVMPLHDLPAERIGGELRKLLLLAWEPSWGLAEDLCAAVWRRLHPALAALDWEAARVAVDRAAALRRARWPGADPLAEALLLASLVHGVSPAGLDALLDRLDVYSQAGFPVRRAVHGCALRQATLPVQATDGELRLLAREAGTWGGLALWFAVACAVRDDRRLSELLERVYSLGVACGVPPPLVGGRDLISLGFPPGPGMGALLERLYQRQLLEDIREAGALLEQASREGGG